MKIELVVSLTDSKLKKSQMCTSKNMNQIKVDDDSKKCR